MASAPIMRTTLYVLLTAILLGTSCSVNRRISHTLSKELNNASVLKHASYGFALYDLSTKKMVFAKNADKYFIPASNTKLFTFYAALNMLPKNISALRYQEHNDSLVFWGTGDPSFLHTTLKGKTAFNFLKASNKKLFFSPSRYIGNKFGVGWSWDDYNDSYQAEISELPIMNNTVQIKGNSAEGLNIYPRNFSSCFVTDSAGHQTSFYVKRSLTNNTFYVSTTLPPVNFAKEIPYITDTKTTLGLLNDTLNKYIGLINMPMPKTAKTLIGSDRDSILTAMLLPSDNFIAEQLLLLCSNQISDSLDTKLAINYVLKNYFSNLPDKPNWVDGSGLSRMNLFSPRDVVAVLELIYNKVADQKKLFAMLPAGGKTGTLKYAYPQTDKPFVFGKTGTLTGVHNQSGYIITKKKKIYLYSFMNNNFIEPTKQISAEIAKTITLIHNNF